MVITQERKRTYVKQPVMQYVKIGTTMKTHGGYSFPVINGEVIPSRPVDGIEIPCETKDCTWWESYLKVKENPEWEGELTEDSWSYMENAKGICECGNEVELMDEYLGAFECPHCKRWHNILGQALLSPEYWESDVQYY